MISQDDLRDHFERQYAQGGPSAGMARAVLERAFDDDPGAQALAQWLDSGVLAQALARQLQAEVPHAT